MSQPAKSVMVAPSRSCTERSGVSRTVEFTRLILAGLRIFFSWRPGQVSSAGRVRKRMFVGMHEGMAILTPEQVATELAATPDWLISDGQLTLTVTRKGLRDALLFVNAVGFLAERAQHHPDIAIAWNAVTLSLSTHSAGGLTERDFALGRQVSGLVSPPEP